MSKSQIKRLAELEELARNEKETEEKEEVEPIRKGPANRFAFFDEGENCDNDGEDQKEKEGSSDVVKDGKSKKQKKRNKKKKEKEEELTDEQLLDKMVEMNNAKNAQSLSKKGLLPENMFGETDDLEVIDIPALENLMKIDPKMFDPSAELKKLLGKAFSGTGANSGGGGSNVRDPKFKPPGRIVKMKTSWPMVKNIGLTMVHDKDEKDIKWFKFVHNSKYEGLERMYWLAEDSMNIGIVQEIIQDSWYHLNSQLMMSNMYRMQEDVTQAADFVERGIFYCEQMFASQFQPFSWKHRVNYLEYENRAFYLLLHRHMLNAIHKRCFETALNTAKFIFKMDPQRDPLAILILIDTIAIRARQYTWLLQFFESALEWKNLMYLPNMVYSLALAKFNLAKTPIQKEGASDALAVAIRHFPSVVTEILDELQIHPDSLIMNHEFFSSFAANREPDGLKQLTKIYVKQSAELWKSPEVLEWLETVTRKVAQGSKDELKVWKERRTKLFVGIAPNIHRLSCLLGYSESNSLTDPIPPPKGRARYRREDHVTRGSDNSFLAGLIHSLYPDYNPDENLGEAVNRNVGGLIGRLRNMLQRDAPEQVVIDPDELMRQIVEEEEEEQNGQEGQHQ